MELEKESILISPGEARKLAQEFADRKIEEFLCLINEKITEAAERGNLYIILDPEDELFPVLEDDETKISEEWIEALEQRGYYVCNPYYNSCGYGPFLLISWEDKTKEELDSDWKYSELLIDTLKSIVEEPLYQKIIFAACDDSSGVSIPGARADIFGDGRILYRLKSNGFDVKIMDNKGVEINMDSFDDPKDLKKVINGVSISWGALTEKG